MDDNVFKCLDLHSVGQHIFYKAVAATKSANIDIVKLAVKQMHSYPFNNRPEQVDDDDYYSKICINVGIHQLPKAVFDRAKELHNDIFGVGFLELSSLITTRKNTIESNQQSFEEQRSKIISDNNHKGKKIDFDISPNIDKLDEIDITLKRCVAELELLTFYEEQIKNTKSTFCENYDDTTVVDRKLKELSFRYLSSTESL